MNVDCVRPHCYLAPCGPWACFRLLIRSCLPRLLHNDRLDFATGIGTHQRPPTGKQLAARGPTTRLHAFSLTNQLPYPLCTEASWLQTPSTVLLGTCFKFTETSLSLPPGFQWRHHRTPERPEPRRPMEEGIFAFPPARPTLLFHSGRDSVSPCVCPSVPVLSSLCSLPHPKKERGPPFYRPTHLSPYQMHYPP